MPIVDHLQFIRGQGLFPLRSSLVGLLSEHRAVAELQLPQMATTRAFAILLSDVALLACASTCCRKKREPWCETAKAYEMKQEWSSAWAGVDCICIRLSAATKFCKANAKTLLFARCVTGGDGVSIALFRVMFRMRMAYMWCVFEGRAINT